MKDLNKIILIGRLGADPVQRETKSGIPLVQFSLATARRTRTDAESGNALDPSVYPSGYKDETIWHRVVAWGRQGEVCAQRLRKGHSVFIEGSLRNRKYVDKDNVKRVAFEVHADSVGFLSVGASRASKESETAVEESLTRELD
ncbi:MAG: single-stranded DNA-binding protein [Oligoflexia bacterium]|nr:single-stranded DNA-binding protein [Oligoflexia bacterium]